MGKKRKQGRKKKHEFSEEPLIEQDEYFYFIAGYTSGGAPYGITWEDARKNGLLDEEVEDGDFENGLVPF